MHRRNETEDKNLNGNNREQNSTPKGDDSSLVETIERGLWFIGTWLLTQTVLAIVTLFMLPVIISFIGWLATQILILGIVVSFHEPLFEVLGTYPYVLGAAVVTNLLLHLVLGTVDVDPVLSVVSNFPNYEARIDTSSGGVSVVLETGVLWGLWLVVCWLFLLRSTSTDNMRQRIYWLCCTSVIVVFFVLLYFLTRKYTRLVPHFKAHMRSTINKDDDDPVEFVPVTTDHHKHLQPFVVVKLFEYLTKEVS